MPETSPDRSAAQLQEWTIAPYTFRATHADAMRIKAAMEIAVNALTDPTEENGRALLALAFEVVVSHAEHERATA